MSKLYLSVVALALATVSSASANVSHHKLLPTGLETAVVADYWVYRPVAPEGAYHTTVTYWPGNRRCVSQLVQLPSRWWKPLVHCETISAQR